MGLDQFMPVAHREHEARCALRDPAVHEVLEKRAPGHGRERLWNVAHDAAQARAETASENDRVHSDRGWREVLRVKCRDDQP